jgi:hypothetical protein
MLKLMARETEKFLPETFDHRLGSCDHNFEFGAPLLNRVTVTVTDLLSDPSYHDAKGFSSLRTFCTIFPFMGFPVNRTKNQAGTCV